MDKLQWDKDFALEQAADDNELLNELVGIFKESCVTDFQSLKNGISSEDIEMVGDAAHSIKGASASLGMKGICDIALAIESDSRKGSVQVAKERIAELNDLLELLQKL